MDMDGREVEVGGREHFLTVVDVRDDGNLPAEVMRRALRGPLVEAGLTAMAAAQEVGAWAASEGAGDAHAGALAQALWAATEARAAAQEALDAVRELAASRCEDEE